MTFNIPDSADIWRSIDLYSVALIQYFGFKRRTASHYILREPDKTYRKTNLSHFDLAFFIRNPGKLGTPLNHHQMEIHIVSKKLHFRLSIALSLASKSKSVPTFSRCLQPSASSKRLIVRFSALAWKKKCSLCRLFCLGTTREPRILCLVSHDHLTRKADC
jgi:hypothetical protein